MVLKYTVEGTEEKPLFQIFFLRNDEGQSVEIEEVKEIDFVELKRRLKRGESIFISPKPRHKLCTNQTMITTRKNAIIL